MVGARKLVLDRNELKEKGGEASTTTYFPSIQKNLKPETGTLYGTIDSLLNEYFVIELHGQGSKEHTKAGLSREKVLVKAFGRRHQ